jgi:hypothetical protein
MAIKYKFAVNGDVLTVVASGYDEGLAEVKAYAKAIIDTAVKNHCHKILCNEQNLAYQLSLTDTYDLAKTTAFAAPKIAKTAILTRPEYEEIIRFWETVALNRGLNIQKFFEEKDALTWLG